MEHLQLLPAFARLSERVCVVRGLNPGKFTLQGTNTYLVGTGTKRILIDTGSGIPEYPPHFLTSLREAGATHVSDIICTHRHGDHIGGIKQVIDSLNSRAGAEIKVHKRMTGRDMGKEGGEGWKYQDVQDLQVFKTEGDDFCAVYRFRLIRQLILHLLPPPGATLTAYHTPGHLDDHIVLYLAEENAVFSGDNVLGQGSTVFEDLAIYMSSLRRMLEIGHEGNVRIYPGHGPVVEDGRAKVNEYLSHRQEREDLILKLLSSPCPDLGNSGDGESATASSGQSWTPRKLVQTIYKSYPESIWDAAEYSVILHLRKLEEQEPYEN
ncbi:Beta-lactamase-like protein 2 [Borealophlyctis nickersoniae]|nr:Beta-lactamase-like protein 2 [Borealophlyctis nickersoniae]